MKPSKKCKALAITPKPDEEKKMKKATLHLQSTEILHWVSDLYMPEIEDSEKATDLAGLIIAEYKSLWVNAFKVAGYDVEFTEQMAPLSGWVQSDTHHTEEKIVDLWDRTVGHLSTEKAGKMVNQLLEIAYNLSNE